MATESQNPTLTEKANAAFQQAAIAVIERARQTGTPIIVCENDHVVEHSGDELKPGSRWADEHDEGRTETNP